MASAFLAGMMIAIAVFLFFDLREGDFVSAGFGALVFVGCALSILAG